MWKCQLFLLLYQCLSWSWRFPDSKIHGANMGPTWVLSAPDGPHVGPMNLAIRVVTWFPDSGRPGAKLIISLGWCPPPLWLLHKPSPHCPACRTTFIATRFRVAVICPIIPVPHCIRVFFYFVWFVFINHIFQFYYELCTYCNILDIYLS